jgi:large subunit ribosomal protein L4
MPDAPVLGTPKEKVSLDEAAFGARFNEPLVHQSVRAELNARRRGTASTKTRGEVSGGGAKPYRQKGTGRARAGSSRSPVWTGGGIVFGPQPRHYLGKVNRKERRAALRSALSLHCERGSLAILDPKSFDTPSTRAAAALLGGWDEPQPTLVVLGEQEAGVALSFRNLPRVSVLGATDVGVVDLIGAASLLVTRDALDALTQRVAGRSAPEPLAEPEAPEDPETAPESGSGA